MLAVSKRLIPASRHMSTCLLAPATSVEPAFLKAPPPPKVIVPRVRAETNKPDLPSLRYSMGSSSCWRMGKPSMGGTVQCSRSNRPRVSLTLKASVLPYVGVMGVALRSSCLHKGGHPLCDTQEESISTV